MSEERLRSAALAMTFDRVIAFACVLITFSSLLIRCVFPKVLSEVVWGTLLELRCGLIVSIFLGATYELNSELLSLCDVWETLLSPLVDFRKFWDARVSKADISNWLDSGTTLLLTSAILKLVPTTELSFACVRNWFNWFWTLARG